MESYKRVIFNADDFGYREEINNGIIFAHRNGVISSTTVMTEREGFEHAVSLIKENPGLKTGLHIDLDAIYRLRRPKRIYKTIPKINAAKKILIEGEINRQIEKFFKAGFKLTHFDSHHHGHMHPAVFPIVAKKAKEFNVPMRYYNGYYKYSKLLYRNVEKELTAILKETGVKHPFFLESNFNFEKDYKTGEIMLHPGFEEAWRNIDLAKSCDPELKNYLREKNIKIISFADL